VAPATHLDAAVQEVVSAVTACGPAALRACKRLVAEVPGMSREEARAYTAEMIATLRASPEGQEGMRAFLEKRPPCFARF
jgi:methylglutaconyl-CoA hydratase